MSLVVLTGVSMYENEPGAVGVYVEGHIVISSGKNISSCFRSSPQFKERDRFSSGTLENRPGRHN